MSADNRDPAKLGASLLALKQENPDVPLHALADELLATAEALRLWDTNGQSKRPFPRP